MLQNKTFFEKRHVRKASEYKVKNTRRNNSRNQEYTDKTKSNPNWKSTSEQLHQQHYTKEIFLTKLR